MLKKQLRFKFRYQKLSLADLSTFFKVKCLKKLKFWKKQRHHVVEIEKTLPKTIVLYNFVSKKQFRFYTHQPSKENYLDTGKLM